MWGREGVGRTATQESLKFCHKPSKRTDCQSPGSWRGPESDTQRTMHCSHHRESSPMCQWGPQRTRRSAHEDSFFWAQTQGKLVLNIWRAGTITILLWSVHTGDIFLVAPLTSLPRYNPGARNLLANVKEGETEKNPPFPMLDGGNRNIPLPHPAPTAASRGWSLGSGETLYWMNHRGLTSI